MATSLADRVTLITGSTAGPDRDMAMRFAGAAAKIVELRVDNGATAKGHAIEPAPDLAGTPAPPNRWI